MYANLSSGDIHEGMHYEHFDSLQLVSRDHNLYVVENL